MPKDYHVFISSKMVELQDERQVLHELLPELGGDLINLRAWVFEDDAPASNQTIREVYLNALKASALYIGLFWNDYGAWTIDEFDKATEWGIDRHIYVKNIDADKRDPQLQAFLDAQTGVISGITPKWFTDLDDLRDQVQRSIEIWLQDHLQRRPGDSAATFAEWADDIPDLPKKLVGRDEIKQQARGLLEDGADILLQGFGGMGKTAIAATIAAEWLDDDMGNVLWLRAGSEDADTLMEALATPFDAQQDIAAAEGRNKLKVLRQIVADNSVTLIVLDDVWDGTALREVLRAFPRSMAVLVTARQRYALDDIIEIGRMGEHEAVDLLAYHARQQYDDPQDAAELCLQLGYHAFALEVAGKTLKVDQIQPRDLLKRIEATPHDITMPEDFAEEGRSSITELLDASLYALDDHTRQTFLGFGRLFALETTAELLAKVLKRDVDATTEDLTTLQRRGLAERLKVPDTELYYYRVHNLAYSYARTISQARGRELAESLPAVQDYVQSHTQDVLALDVTRSNWVGAAQLAASLGQQQTLVEIIHPVLQDYLSSRGHTLPLMTLVRAAIDAASALGNDYGKIRTDLIGKLGTIYLQRGDIDNALASFQEDLQLVRELGLKESEVRLLSLIGALTGDETYLNDAFEVAEAVDDDYLKGYVLEKQAYVAQSKGDFPATRDYSLRQVELAERIGDETTLIFALLNLGTALNRIGELDEALAHHQRALQIAENANNPVWTGYALQNIAEDYHGLGQRDDAQQHFADALEIFSQHGIQAHVEEIETFLMNEGYSK